MRITILTKQEEEKELIFKREKSTDPNNGFIWIGTDIDFSISIQETLSGACSDVQIIGDIISSKDEIISQFNEFKSYVNETESSGIEFNEEGNTKVHTQPQPYDPELIRVESKPFSIYQVNELIEEKDIDLSPDFQRHFVWKEIEKRSRLIESIMLRIPLPVFYLAQDKEGKFQVVDGVQRLTVINQFLNNKFKLRNLEYLKDCEGMYFKKDGFESIDPKYARRITQAQLTFNVIDPQTPTRVKFEIFKRLNQGGKPLNSQEIRNCMASEKTRNLLKELASSDIFHKATNYSVNATRMEDHEMVLRFVAFYYSEYLNNDFKYSGVMDDYLDETLELLNNAPEEIHNRLKVGFLNAMENAYFLFGVHAFRKCYKEHLIPGARKQFINKSLFTSWSVLLSDYDSEKVKSNNQGNCLSEVLANEIESNQAFFEALTYGTNDQNRIQTSFHTAKEIIKNNLYK